MNAELIDRLMHMSTDDYQNRKGNYPRSDMPDTIDVYNDSETIIVRADFKNTSEQIAEAWLRRTLRVKVGGAANQARYSTSQTGDYHDDWVCAEAEFTL